MTALSDFVNEQKNKATSSSSFTSIGDLRSKLSSGVFSSSSGVFSSGLALFGRRGEQTDEENLIGSSSDSTTGQLPSNKNRRSSSNGWFSNDESFLGLSRLQRIMAFFLCLIAAMICFGLATLMIPVLVLKARKFAALNTLGSLLLLLSFAFLWGPSSYARHLLSRERVAVTATYLSLVILTLYTSLWLQSTVITLICASFQLFALIWFVLSYIPGGDRGLRFLSSIFCGMVRSENCFYLIFLLLFTVACSLVLVPMTTGGGMS